MGYEYDDELERMRARRNTKTPKRTERRQRYEKEGYEETEYETPKRKRSYEIQRRKKRRKRKILIIELIVLVAVLATAFFMFRKKMDGYWTIAVFGVDSRDGNLGKGSLSDVEMICNINKATGEITLVSVFRDTYLKIDSAGKYHKINEAYFKGGHKQAVEALNENLDLKIDDYATFNWKAVADTINILGGIDLEITDKEFQYINSFITETVESTNIPSVHLTSAGMNHLDGVQAVAYARLRLMDTDFNRTARQRKVISLAMEKAKQADWAVLNQIIVTVLPQVSTSVGVGDIIPIARNLSKYHIGETGGFPFSRQTERIGKMDCVIPTTLESNVTELHRFLFGIENYNPSSTVKKISAKIAKDSGLGEAGSIAPPDGTGGKGGGGQKPAQTQAPEAETPPEATEETTIDEVIVEPIEETTEPETTEPDKELGPGAGLEETPDHSKEPTKKPEEEKPPAAPETTPATPGETKPVETTAAPPAPGNPDSNEGAGPGSQP